MNRKNVILIAILINAGLLAVLLIAALTTTEEAPATNHVASVEPSFQLPKFNEKFEEKPLFQELSTPVLQEPVKLVEVSSQEPMVHKLPQLVQETTPPAPIVVAPPVHKAATSEVVVKKGDTLDKIAKANQTSVDEIIKMNNLSSSFLKVGQVLKIPSEKTLPIAKAKQPEAGPEYYTMKVGENPWAIAMKHHMKVDELLRLNGLNDERARKLKPGDRLRIR